ncbi:metallophosphoesterase family protein [Flavitalea sp.]|nr:metallophosphoesterase [Flavitalea sp.]
MENFSRRKFINSLGVLSAALPLGASAFDFVPSKGNEFNFVLLGDLHYDKLEHHDMNYVKAKYPNDIGQIENYSRITRDNFPLLMDVTKEKAREVNADFWLQLGDFVEGLCGSALLARKQTNDFISYVASKDLKRPFFVVKGNHDITGEGAREVFKETVLAWQTKEQKKQLSTANSTFVYKTTRFVIFDCYTADESLEWLKKVLKDHKEENLIFCVHQPIVPYNARANWHVFAKPGQTQKREELLNLLGQHRAIAFTGHLHKTSVLVRSTPKGNFVQVAIGSVIPAPNAPVTDHLKGVQSYTSDLLQLEPKFSPESLDERKTNLEKEAPFIRHFEYADFCGYATVGVSAKSAVTMSIYANTDKKAWANINLTDLLKA